MGPFPSQPPATRPLPLLLAIPFPAHARVNNISTSFSATALVHRRPRWVLSQLLLLELRRIPTCSEGSAAARGRGRNLRLFQASRGISTVQGSRRCTHVPSTTKPVPFPYCFNSQSVFERRKAITPGISPSLSLPLRSFSITALIWLGPLSDQGDTDGVLIR